LFVLKRFVLRILLATMLFIVVVCGLSSTELFGSQEQFLANRIDDVYESETSHLNLQDYYSFKDVDNYECELIIETDIKPPSEMGRIG